MGTMKRRSPDSPRPERLETADSPADPLAKEDALWDLLGEASVREPDAFFARNVVRQTRLLADTESTWGTRLAGFLFSKKAILPLAAATCVGVVAVTQFNQGQPAGSQTGQIVKSDPLEDPSTALAELVIEESLVAAAEDPSQFTHDEVVAMVGL